MRALKLVNHMQTNADRMSEAVSQKIRSSERCSELLVRVPAEEQARSTAAIYRDLTDWLATEADSSIEERYIALGTRRAEQGVPFSNLYWAVCIAHEHLWEYMQQETLLDEPVEFWGGVMLLRSLTRFFDRALYFALLGYQKAGKGELAGASAA
ncbi:MAG TPA: hypothetical protein VEI52_20320 [Terriglobales bacterium]|nr:hypothetical protein [Terriglobales bacterium]